MNTKKIRFMIQLCLLILAAAACSASKAPVVTYEDSVDIVLGKSTIEPMMDAGYRTRYLENKELESKTWDSFYPTKQELCYGTMYAGNKTSKTTDFKNGVIFKIILTYDDPEYPMGEVLVNGINFAGFTKDQVKEAMMDQRMTLNSDVYLTFEDGKYEYVFRFEEDDDILDGITIHDGTDATFNFQ